MISFTGVAEVSASNHCPIWPSRLTLKAATSPPAQLLASPTSSSARDCYIDSSLDSLDAHDLTSLSLHRPRDISKLDLICDESTKFEITSEKSSICRFLANTRR